MSKVVRTRRKKNNVGRKNSIRRKNTLRRKNSVRRKVKRNYSKSRKRYMKNKRMKGGGPGSYYNEEKGVWEPGQEESRNLNRWAQPLIGTGLGAGIGTALAAGGATLASGGTAAAVGAGVGLAAGLANYGRMYRTHKWHLLDKRKVKVSDSAFQRAMDDAHDAYGNIRRPWSHDAVSYNPHGISKAARADGSRAARAAGNSKSGFGWLPFFGTSTEYERPPANRQAQSSGSRGNSQSTRSFKGTRDPYWGS